MKKVWYYRILAVLSVLVFSPESVSSSNPDTTLEYYSQTSIRYDDFSYVKSIASVQLSPDLSSMTPPILQLNGGDQLHLSFDDLTGDFKTLSYTVIHCSAEWEPSNVSIPDFIDGFPEQQITDYSFSRNTLQQYTHYKASFPHEQFRLLLSGNYILKVFQDNDQEKIILTRRFMIVDEKVTVSGSVHAPTIVSDRNFKQEVDFTLLYPQDQITNPFQEIYPVIMQNGRRDNMVAGIKPQFVVNNELRYDYEDINVFKGGKEFRWFDTRTLRLQTERVDKIDKDSAGYHVYLVPDEKRAFKRYMNTPDINGRYLIHTQDNNDSDVEAEYCWVHFFLPWESPVPDGNMYILGGLTDWKCSSTGRMTYNRERRGYEAVMYLKQGYYNYEYVFLKDKETIADEFITEGMHWETENDYWIFIYFRRVASRTDELVAVKRFNSRQ